MNKVSELEQQITQAKKAYYNDLEILSDDEYDALIYELSTLDPNNSLLKEVGAEPETTEWVKVKHLTTLGSLNKVNTPEEMSNWIANTLSNNKEGLVVIEKLDGLSLGLQYEDGKLTKGALRGSGSEGENIYSNVIKMHGVVKTLNCNFSGTIRGEIVLTKENHQKHFPEYANPRNASSGLCRRLDGEGSEHLSLMVYDVIGDQEFTLEQDKLKFLADNGFTLPNYQACKNAQEVNTIWKNYQEAIRESLGYEIDGLVCILNDIELQQSLNDDSLRPKFKMAFKFANQFVKTTVKEITITVGNSGRITPICWFEPVNLLGSVIEKASIYNLAYINTLKIDVGAEVLVCKAGEIIPRVEKVVKSTGTIVKLPDVCPSCDTKIQTQGEYLICPNTHNCPAQVVGKIKNYVAQLNLLELGEVIVEKLVESGLVKDIADLYTISIDDIAKLDRMGKKSATNVYNSIHSKKNLPLEVLIGSLSIPMVAVQMVKLVIEAGYDTLDKLFDLTYDRAMLIKGVGSVKAQSLITGLIDNKELINKILRNGVTMEEKIEGKLSGVSVVFTGKMEHKRDYLEDMVKNAGGAVRSSVTRGTTFLVIADINSNSSKAVNARKLGTKLISENDLISMIG